MAQSSTNDRREFPQKTSKYIDLLVHGLPGMVLTVLLIAASPWLAYGQGGSKGDKVYNLHMTNCGGFTSEDAAKIIGLPASKLEAKTQKIGNASWTCSFTTSEGKGVSFSVSVTENANEAAVEMERLRGNLEVAAETAPFKDRLPGGAYSEISGPGLGDESVWTDVNGTLTVRKGNITLQVLTPSGKMEQIKVAQAFFAKF